MRNMSYHYHSPYTQFDNVWINPTHTYTTSSDQAKKSTPPTSSTRRPAIKKPFPKKTSTSDTAGRSLPVNIPARDWGKTKKPAGENFDDEDDEDEGIMGLAPHEYLARTRVASLSVHEGIGRTLKGRDLSRVRDAIWKHTGFED
ncbi:uncharacterized protein LOC124910959 [Impatiens glandulifera]|uniref:uncharacterized protein LOC124910959 n=1 Tax=Impatiens glandulifera TaxID=253017 RepID=UPI001FB10855|nr:uncharacterized protein LOC124910959 [Impatiens glandulifera]